MNFPVPRRLSTLFWATSLVSSMTVAPWALAPARAGADPGHLATGTSDAALVLQIAQLTDQLQVVEEKIASDQIHRAVDQLELQQAERVMRADAIDAYISGGQPATSLSFLEPSPVTRYYTDLVMKDQQGVVAALHAAEAKVSRDVGADQADFRTLDALNSQLDQERAALEAMAAQSAALAVQRQEDAARAAAMQRQQSARQQAVDAAAAGAGSPPAPTAVSATQSQQGTQGQYPFGPLSPSQLSQYRLAETGQTVSGVASWYGPGFDGRTTASGAIYDENAWTCASPNLPFGTMLLVTSGPYGVLVEVNDRGPYAAGRVLDLSHAAAQALHSTGLVDVVAYVVAPA